MSYNLMNKIRKILLISIAITLVSTFDLYTGGNSFAISGGWIEDKGFTFNSLPAKFNSYFYTQSVADYKISMELASSVVSSIKTTAGGKTVNSETNSPSDNIKLELGTFKSVKGYNKISISITSKSGSNVGEGLVTKLVIDGALLSLTYVKDNSGTYRRGASSHLWVNQGQLKDVSYYYSEINVPVGFDPIGTYYMANGFGQGYFGYQVNSATERRFLFSVWSGYQTDNPSQIPSEYTVRLNRKGADVTTGQFGGQGSGGQSYIVYPWKAGNTYHFLTKAQPSEDATTFTSWFRDPSSKINADWRLMAEFTRPKVKTYLNGLYSFIECFNPNYGNQTRLATYRNQWYYDSSNSWKEVTSMTFTHDGTADDNLRRDVEGGLYTGKKSFFLKSGGFFNKYTPSYSSFTREANKIPPTVDFATLP